MDLPLIALPDESVRAHAQAAMDGKVKPRGSLGRLETLAATLAAIRGVADPGPLEPAIVLAAADHGYAEEGVSAYPQEVTRQMLASFAAGGSAVCVLARQAGARLVVCDAGVVEALGDAAVRELRIGPGTRNATREPAMTREQAEQSISAGLELARELARDGVGIIALGEMGIANTTAASALAAAFTGASPALVCGRGTGIDDAGLATKVDVVERALALHRPDVTDALGVLAAVGGFEIGLLAGVTLGAASERIPIVLDGFIATSAALVATVLAPAVTGSLIAGHRSIEPGHRILLERLGLEPLLDLELRLGEGSGAALALPLCAAALAILREMASFRSAGVTDTGR